MAVRYEKRIVLCAIALCLGIAAAMASTAAARKPGGRVTRKTYDVRRLAHKGNVADLEHLITQMVEPRSWMMVGGQGAILPKGKGKITVVQTAGVQRKVGDLLAALGELPPVKKSRDAKGKKKLKGKGKARTSGAESTAHGVKMKTAKKDSEAKSGKKAAKPKAVKHVLEIPVGKDAKADPVIVVYYVKDLLGKRRTPDFEPLIRKITATVAPKTWNERGGEGAIEIYAKGRALVVLQSKKVHKQLSKMLEELHRKQRKSESGAPARKPGTGARRPRSRR